MSIETADGPMKRIIGYLIPVERRHTFSTPTGKGSAISASVRDREDPADCILMRAAAACLPPVESEDVGNVRHEN